MCSVRDPKFGILGSEYVLTVRILSNGDRGTEYSPYSANGFSVTNQVRIYGFNTRTGTVHVPAIYGMSVLQSATDFVSHSRVHYPSQLPKVGRTIHDTCEMRLLHRPRIPLRLLSTPPNPSTKTNLSAKPASKSTNAPQLFDTRAKALQKARAVLSQDYARYGYIREHMASTMIDRLHEVNTPLTNTIDLFCGTGYIHSQLNKPENTTIRERIGTLCQIDIHESLISRARENAGDSSIAGEYQIYREDVQKQLDFEDGSVDCIISSGGLHWINDIPHLLHTLHRKLRPTGVLLLACLGNETLQELRISLQQAEQSLHSRLAPRTSPMLHTRDVANLLQRAGFGLPMVDVERFAVEYKDMWTVMRHVRGMGEGNCLREREVCTRGVFEEGDRVYGERFRYGEGVAATWEVIYGIGWREGARRPRGPKGEEFDLTEFVGRGGG